MVGRWLQRVPPGMSEWLLQRATAVLMALYAVGIALRLVLAPPQGYVGWQALFASQTIKLATFVFVLGMLLHAWIGLRDVLADYVPHIGLRSLLRKLVTLALLALAAWTWLILWSVAA